MRAIEENECIGIIGLGYVGLPLAVEFGKKRRVIGFDTDSKRIDQLKNHEDRTRELDKAAFRLAAKLEYTTESAALSECRVFIVTVPTPIDEHKKPDLTPLREASQTIGELLRPGCLVIYESTVYPGATEEVCVPILEEASGLEYNSDFFCGYSPERINPGDKNNTLTTITKVTSGSTPGAAKCVEALYGSIIVKEQGIHRTSSIKVAEAAKVIENIQRDVNIALMNELSIVFDKLGIDTGEVLEAARTKWNFMDFRPGLVGGHCIGIDPYYLLHKAMEHDCDTPVIRASREVNAAMGGVVVERLDKMMVRKGIAMRGARVLILGLTFKENCPDMRNTRVVDMVISLRIRGAIVDVHDPFAEGRQTIDNCEIDITNAPTTDTYDAIVVAVAHQAYKQQGVSAVRSYGKRQSVLFDLKGLFKRKDVDGRL